MATNAKSIEYKIEKNVPIVRWRVFDEALPEYVTMMKLKPGDSFEFPAARVRAVQACRAHIVKVHPEQAFTATGEASIKTKKLPTGRCWRLPDGSTKKYKNRNSKK